MNSDNKYHQIARFEEVGSEKSADITVERADREITP
jgi:hypothetical protein